MSTDPSSSAGLPGRSRPVLSDLSKETTEEDLWNLDDDSQHTPLPPAREPAPAAEDSPDAKAPQKPMPGTVRPIKGSSKNVVIEPNAEKIVAKPKAPRPDPQRTKPADTFDDLDEGDSKPEQLAFDLSAPPAGEESAPVENLSSTPPAVEGEPSISKEESPAPEPVTYVSLSDDEPETAPAPAAENSSSSRLSLGSLKISRRELIGLGSFAFILLLGAIWALTNFFGIIRFKKNPRIPPKLPAAGKYITVSKQETFWREPIVSGPDRDATQLAVVILPILELTLSSQTSGAVRVIFKDDKGRSIGDAITRSVTAGKFDNTGAPLGTFPSTAGFEEMGSFNTYVAGVGDPWSITVLEGPSATAPADQFVKLVDIPIFGVRR